MLALLHRPCLGHMRVPSCCGRYDARRIFAVNHWPLNRAVLRLRLKSRRQRLASRTECTRARCSATGGGERLHARAHFCACAMAQVGWRACLCVSTLRCYSLARIPSRGPHTDPLQNSTRWPAPGKVHRAATTLENPECRSDWLSCSTVAHQRIIDSYEIRVTRYYSEYEYSRTHTHRRVLE